MIIKEADIRNFGKLQNKKYTFSPGLNVIYGANEAGKTTLQQFMTSMFFGLEKKRGKSVSDEYQRYEPWEAPAYFTGSLIFETGGKTFLLERNFYHKEKRSRLINMGDMEELSVDHGDLQMLLGNVGRSTYENTYCISQKKLLPGKELGILLEDEKNNLLQTRDAGFQLSKVLQILTEKKNAFEKEKKELEQARRQKLNRIKFEEQILVNDIENLERKQKDKQQELRRQEVLLRGIREQKREIPGKEMRGKNTGARQTEDIKAQDIRKEPEVRWSPWIIVGIVGVILFSMLGKQATFPIAVLHILQIICVVLILAGLIITLRKKKVDPVQETGDKGATKTEENSWEEAYRGQCMRCEKLRVAEEIILQEIQEKEIQRANLQAQQEELLFESAEEAAADRNQKAAALAAENIQQLAREIAEDSDDCINEWMSAILSRITDGKYDGLGLDETRNLMVEDHQYRRRPEIYSHATMQQMYFAYRMAAGKFLTKEEPMPFLLDEAFSGYDEDRLRAVLRWLSEQEQQIFLFTCRHLEAEILRSESISFQEIYI